MSRNLNDIEATEAAKGVDMNNLPVLTAENVFDVIWDADVNRCSVSDRDEKGKWRNAHADILLDKQSKANGGADSLEDSAPRPLFHTVREAALEKPTYATFMQQLDNYDAVVNNIEYLNGGELDEIDDFLNAILETDCMKICYKYITDVLGFSYPSMKLFKRQLFSMWFEIHNLRVDAVLAPSEVEEEREKLRENHKNGEGSDSEDESPAVKQVLVKYCSGFEHVFMGEITIPDGETIGNVLGYHNWIKFYMDEMTQLIDFLGTKYTKPSLSKIGAPFVCVKFRWDQDGHVFIKERGSFFVGCSPEFSIAVGTICFFETMTEQQAHNNGWENRIPTKFKCKREIGGYIYEYYICRQEKYLVSCFQELLNITEETSSRLAKQQAERDAAMFEAKMQSKLLKQKSQVQEEVGLSLPNGVVLTKKALNRQKRRLLPDAEAAGVQIDTYVSEGLMNGTIVLPSVEDSEKSEEQYKEEKREKSKKLKEEEEATAKQLEQQKLTETPAETKKREKAERDRLNKIKGEEMKRKAVERKAAEDRRLAELAVQRHEDSQHSHVFAEMFSEPMVNEVSTSLGSTPALSSIDSNEMEILALPLPATFEGGGSLTLSPCHRGLVGGRSISPIRTPESKPIAVKPKQSVTKSREFQKYVKEHMSSTKCADIDIADKEAYKRAQENWKELGNDIKKGMGMPMIRKIRENLVQGSHPNTSNV